MLTKEPELRVLVLSVVHSLLLVFWGKKGFRFAHKAK